jgi:hypothetical protein
VATPGNKRFWISDLRITPGSLIYALLLTEAFLILSQKFRWFAFNEHKGWTVLICLAAVIATLLGISIWFVAARSFRWRFQFSLRSLLALILVVATACGWMTAEMKRARTQADLIGRASKLGCGILFDYNLSESGDVVMVSGAIPGTTRLNNVLGDNFFREIVGAFPRDDASLQLLKDQTSIRRLNLNDSQVTSAGLRCLERMSRLEWLDLRDAPAVSDEGLKYVQRLIRLRELLLRRTGVSDTGMAYLKDLRQLEVLDLGMTKVTDVGLKQLAGLTRLRQLLFWANRIEDAGLSTIHGMTKLEILDLGFAPVTDAGLENLESLSQLRYLGLRGSGLTDAGLFHISELRQLRELDLFKTGVTDAGLERLAALGRLEKVHLGENRVTPAGIEKLRHALPNCKIE